jgi:hypothetical protein
MPDQHAVLPKLIGTRHMREIGCRIVDLADLRDGSVFLADFDGGPIVRAMKAFYVNPSGIHGGKIVTVGPFRDEDEGKPGVYEPNVVRQLAVVDLTGVLAFTFSTEPEHVTFKLPPSRECPGLVVLVEDDAYLGCRFHEDNGLWETAYLDMATGEIVFRIDAANACISRQWALQATA